MAIVVLDSVLQKQPFLVAGTDTTTLVGNIKVEEQYYLQPYTLLNDTDVVDDTKYSNLQLLLVTEMICCEIIKKQTLQNVEGSGGTPGTGAKRIKKGKADVVEAEFDYGKASDGNFLGGTAEELLLQHTRKACEYARMLKYTLPLCIGVLETPIIPPPFVTFAPPDCGCC